MLVTGSYRLKGQCRQNCRHVTVCRSKDSYEYMRSGFIFVYSFATMTRFLKVSLQEIEKRESTTATVPTEGMVRTTGKETFVE
jgi:hypothetical protein